MSDDNNQKSRGPRKGAGGGGKGTGGGKGRPPARGASAGGERKPFRGRPEGGERPPRGATSRTVRTPGPAGDRPFRGRPGGEERPRQAAKDGERAPRRFEKPAGARDGAPRPPRAAGDKAFRARQDGERSASRPPREGDRPERSGKSFDARKSSGNRDGGGEKRFERPRSDRPARGGGERPRRPRETDIAAPRAVLPSVQQEPERIAKVMARAGIASRRDSEAMIAEGRVSVNGKVIASPALDVGQADVVLIDGEALPARERTRMWLYHKPRGLVTTNHDPEGRPTVFDALPEDLPRVLSIGRLDINTEGLLLLTNDGGLARMLELPETGWLRRYRVRAFGSVTQDRLDTLRDGVTIEGVSYGPVTARFEREQGSNTWLVVDLREGKNREVKTVLEHLGLVVNRLIRVSFGPFQLSDLPEGEVDEIGARVLKDQLGAELMAKAGVDFEAPRRDEIPAAPPMPAPRAPGGDDRPRRREAGGERGGRDVVRTPSKDDRSEKPWKRTVWRDADTEPQRERKAPPRRGADPKLERQAREATGAIERRRGNAIADPKGRRVLVERVSAPAREEAPRGQPRAGAGRSLDEKPQRRPREDAGGQDRSGDRPWQERAPREAGERPPRRPPERQGDDRPRGRSFGDKPGGERKSAPGRAGDRAPARGERSGGRPFGGGKPSGERPSGGKPSGGKPSGGRAPGGKGPRPAGGGRGKRD